MKKNIAILIYSLAGGGAERVVSILLDELKDIYNITLVLMNDTIVYDIPKGQKIIYLEKSEPFENGIKKLLKLPFLGWKYKTICIENKIDISLSFMNRPVYIAMFAKLFGLKIENIISERSTPSILYAPKTLQSKISKLLIKKLYPKADKIIANSNGNSLDLINNFQIEKSNIITIYNPFDIEKIQRDSQVEVKDISFTPFTFITVGRVDHGKNHRLLIEVFKRYDLKKTQLLIIGKGPLLDELQKLVKEYQLENQVLFLGFHDNPYKYLSKSDCFVFSSQYEGFPNVVVEAMVCGLPIISTDCKSGPREILEDGTIGKLVKVNDIDQMAKTMIEVYKNQELQQELSKKSFLRAVDFEKNKIIKQFISVIEK